MFLTDGPDAAEQVYVFAHGAGGSHGHAVHDHRRARTGRARHPRRALRISVHGRAPHGRQTRRARSRAGLLNTWREVAAQLGGGSRLFIGGKSMGGRMATLVADELKVRGAVVFGYPFHPPGQPNKLRTAHLETLTTPMLVLQGERDVFGSRDDVAGYRLSPQIRIEWIPDGDHSLKPRAKSGTTERQNLLHAIDTAAAFMTSR